MCCDEQHCGGCSLPRDAPAKCCNCAGSHPAKYRRCSILHLRKSLLSCETTTKRPVCLVETLLHPQRIALSHSYWMLMMSLPCSPQFVPPEPFYSLLTPLMVRLVRLSWPLSQRSTTLILYSSQKRTWLLAPISCFLPTLVIGRIELVLLSIRFWRHGNVSPQANLL